MGKAILFQAAALLLLSSVTEGGSMDAFQWHGLGEHKSIVIDDLLIVGVELLKGNPTTGVRLHSKPPSPALANMVFFLSRDGLTTKLITDDMKPDHRQLLLKEQMKLRALVGGYRGFDGHIKAGKFDMMGNTCRNYGLRFWCTCSGRPSQECNDARLNKLPPATEDYTREELEAKYAEHHGGA